MQVTDKQGYAALKAYEPYVQEIGSLQGMKAAIEAAIAAAPAVEQKPFNLISGADIVWYDHETIEAGEFKDWLRSMPKLYINPQPKRKRLHIHQLLKMYSDKNGDWCAIARAVEEYHGIGDE